MIRSLALTAIAGVMLGVAPGCDGGTFSAAPPSALTLVLRKQGDAWLTTSGRYSYERR